MIRKRDFKGLNIKSDDFMIETEIEAKAIKKRFKIIEIPIKLSHRMGGSSKFFRQPRQWLKIRKFIKKNNRLVSKKPEVYRVVDYSRS